MEKKRINEKLYTIRFVFVIFQCIFFKSWVKIIFFRILLILRTIHNICKILPLFCQPSCIHCLYICLPLPGSWWSWSYVSWIYNYLCNQCLSPLKLRVRTPFMARCTRYNICDKFVSDLWQVGGFLWVLQFPPPIKLIAMI